jgi:gamma-glutamyl-gamma-aminobutyrate hydrolase PuuD
MKIALSQRTIIQNGKIYDSIERVWYDYLKDHDLTFIPNRLDQDFELIAENADVLVLTGGDNSPIRRQTERRAAIAMLKRNKRIVGVCHGAFLLTKFLGGTTGRKLGHKDGTHKVVHNGCEYLVNSNHRNYIITLPKSAKIIATDEDGHCEAWVDHNIAAVVWHPERMESDWIPDEIAGFFGKNALTEP